MNSDKKTMGHIKEVTSSSNPIIKSLKALHLKKNRDSEGLFMAEGLKLITDAIDSGWEVSTLVYAKNIATQPRLQDIAVKARTNGTNLLEVSEKILGSLTRRDNPQMVVGIFKQKWMRMDAVKPVDNDLWIALDRVRDPGNLGTIIRTADCVGAKGVMLIGDSTDPWSLEAVRATMGSVFSINLARCSTKDFSSWRHKWGGLVVGTHLEGAVDYRNVDYTDKPVLLLMGNEQQGLSDELVELCSEKVLIPMSGRADSLNLAIATGVMAFEIKRSAINMPQDVQS
ncbi:MAG: RNA methyltransferase [Rhizobiaceae bacterium]|nr:RNA methyltransferase [Rhizobiaceae bacterium]